MKARSMVVVLSVMISVLGCGTSSSACPEGQVENDQGECVPIPECWGDNDCPTQHACIDFKCVLHPECETDADCSRDKICNEEYKCVSYTLLDPCFEQPCTDSCINCGNLTSCYENTCKDACEVYYELDRNARDIGCFELSGVCTYCTCWNDGHQDLDPYGSGECIPYSYPVCNETAAEEKKYDDTDWDQAAKDIESRCRAINP